MAACPYIFCGTQTGHMILVKPGAGKIVFGAHNDSKSQVGGFDIIHLQKVTDHDFVSLTGDGCLRLWSLQEKAMCA
jgi:hypothetical protein